MELRKDEQLTLNIDGFIISQNLHNKATATSLFGITDKDNLNIGHDDRTWVLEKDIICDTCNNCVSCQTCNSCNGCVSTVGCQDSCQGCTGSCTGCADGCYETCFGDCYTCQDCQTGCTSCNACTAGCDGGCQTECYACVSCDGCVGCDGDCVGCFGGCQENCQTCTGCASCTACVSCQTGCQTGCNSNCVSCFDSRGGGCTSKCQAKCQTCTGCDNNCYKGCTSCDGCTGSCQGGCQTGCQICTGGCQICVSCNGCTSCDGCNGCVGCTSCASCTSCNGCVGCYGTVCDNCTGGCQGGCQSGCQTGCTTGSYCYGNQCGPNTGPTPDPNPDPEPEYPEGKKYDYYCHPGQGGGLTSGELNACSTGGYDGEKDLSLNPPPPEWEGSDEDWANADRETRENFLKENGYEIVDHGVDTSVDHALPLKVLGFDENDNVKVKVDKDPETGDIKYTYIDADTGEVKGEIVKNGETGEYTGWSQSNDGTSFTHDYDGVDPSDGFPTGGETTVHRSDEEWTSHVDVSDGTTSTNDPNSGKEVNTDPSGQGGCS